MRRTRGPRERRGVFARLSSLYASYLRAVLRMRWLMFGAYAAASGLLLFLLLPRIGTELFPKADARQFQLRLRAPAGTRIERTEVIALKALDVIRNVAGPDNVAITTGFIGVQPPSYPVNTIYLWTSGPQEAVLRVALKRNAPLRGEALQEELRSKLRQALPGTAVSFEAGDIVTEVMSFGSPTPVEVAVQGPNLANDRMYASKVEAQLARIPWLRDLEYAQPLDTRRWM
jgi:multidrug efflux pump subunit AcrB